MAIQHFGQHYIHYSNGDNCKKKTFIFVKLTDSALNAIENHLSSKVIGLSQPTIQFQSNSNQGILNFPTNNLNNDTERRFCFNLSNVDADGPQGNFECLYQTNSKILESLGSMQYKMQIQASEDIYQKTKNRMATIEKESKKNCTKVIKETGPNVGRKVKVKKGTFLNQFHHLPSFNGTTKACSPPIKLNINNTSISTKFNSHLSVNNILNNHSSLKPSQPSNSFNSDIIKKPIRERVIHLLALRPYKKPELLAKLMKDGIREKDKKNLSSLFSQISNLKDNAYHLAKHAWHEVQIDEWPYYNQEEKETVRKRNPLSISCSKQNSSSPFNSIQASSSSPTFSNVNNNDNNNLLSNNSKRTADNLWNSKRQRLSQANQAQSRRPKSPKVANLETSCYSDLINGWANKPKSIEYFPTHSLKLTETSVNLLNNNSDQATFANKSNNWTSHNNNNNIISQIDQESSDFSSSNKPIISNSSPYFDPFASETSHSISFSHNSFNSCIKNSETSNHNVNNIKKIHDSSSDKLSQSNLLMVTSNLNGSACSSPTSSPDSGTGSNDGSLSTTSSKSLSSIPGELPDYAIKYVDITNEEQRSRYRSDFNSEYEEYRKLHCNIDQVAKKFTAFEKKLKSTVEGSDEWNKTMDHIIGEYEATKRNYRYTEARKRVLYLHDKLSHIKKLINEYDAQLKLKNGNEIKAKSISKVMVKI